MVPELNGPNEPTPPCEVPSISLETEKFCPLPLSAETSQAPAHVDASQAGEHNS